MSFDAFVLRPRLIVSMLTAVVIVLALPQAMVVWQRALIGWCIGVSLYVILIVWLLSRATPESVRRQASALDDSAWVILMIAMAATVASFGAIGALLANPPSPSESRVPDIILAATTMVLSWVFMQITFAVHYTHIFFGDEAGSPRGGLQFAGDNNPDFWDFVYFTVSVGATAQTSDTGVTSKRMRRIVTAQAVYSFFFNTAVLAMAINIAAGLFGH